MSQKPSHTSTYRRGQLEYALWKVFSGNTSAEVPHAFALRIKKLIDLDRSQEPSQGMSRAFSGVTGANQGRDAEYTAFDAFCLAVGVDFTDIGFKQSEALFILRYLRRGLEAEYERLMEYPFIMADVAATQSFPKLPSMNLEGKKRADQSVHLTFHVRDPQLHGHRGLDTSIQVLNPVICLGFDALAEYLRDNLLGERKAVVIELAQSAHLVTQHLAAAPVIKRGRK